MDICYLVADNGIPIFGRKGCSTHVRETCRGLFESGHSVTIYAPNRGEDERVDPGATLHIIPPLNHKKLGADARMFLYNFRLLKHMREVFRRRKPDVMYERYSLYAFAGKRLAEEFHLPRILEANAHLVEEQRERLHFPWLAQRFENHIVRTSKRLIVVSQPLKESYLRLGLSEDRIVVMPMAVDVQRFRPGVPPRDLNALFGIRDKVVVGYVGTLTGWHGVDMLYDVAHHFDRERIGCVFLVVGGDEQQVVQHRERTMREGLSDRLIFAGSIPYEDVPSYISAMDITVITNSTQFASPTKLFEYQAMGKPSVAPELPPIREALTHESEGLLFTPGSIAGLSDSIRRLIDSPELRQRMGRSARERVVRSHSWDVNVNRIIEIYEKMLDSPNHTR